ncbi:MAG TPA: hypothetical protein VGG03_04915 [Thermoanaerobaculia bacterium]
MRTRLLATVVLVAAFGSSALLAADWPALRPEVSVAVRHDVSPPFRSLQSLNKAAVAPRPDREIQNRVPLDLAQRFHPTAPTPDPVISGPATDATPSPSLTFEGLSDDDNAAVVGGRVVPPDTNGDVGLTRYVQTINLIFAVYDKATGARVFGPVPIKNLWAGFGGKCETDNDGDPTVVYDDAAGRWVISQFAIGGDGHQCVAVSTTSDPAGSYFRYDFLVSPGRTNDYPKMGVWPDGYYVTYNEFTSSFQGAVAVAFERDKMLLGQPAQMVKFGPLTCGTECYFGLQPAHYDGGTAPPAGSPAPIIQAWDDETWGTGAGADGYRMFNFTVNWNSPGSSTLIQLPQVNAPEFDAEFCNFSRACILQPSPGERLDVFGQVTMYRAMYRNFGTHESLVVSHSTDVTGRSVAGVRWSELRNTGGGWFLHQTGTISPTSDSRWMSSIAMDKQGNIAVGYSVSSRNVKPSIRYATRSAGDPLGTMGTEVTLQAGAGVQQSSSNRWGDYSALSVDPSDGCTFWYTTEYYANNGSFDFKTRIGKFTQPGCN